jgi:hypothetical protein
MKRGIPYFVTAVGIIPSPLCFATQNIGEKQRSVATRRGVKGKKR